MQHLITFTCMILATILWIGGFTTGSLLFFVAAGAFELLFWKRVITSRLK